MNAKIKFWTLAAIVHLTRQPRAKVETVADKLGIVADFELNGVAYITDSDKRRIVDAVDPASLDDADAISVATQALISRRLNQRGPVVFRAADVDEVTAKAIVAMAERGAIEIIADESADRVRVSAKKRNKSAANAAGKD